ncbi:MAG: hypothetical protein NWE92_04145 [Candidatus Bathyarchaeota archaeon]|nr:hypothetical protein [Candidatus Bathyarchaeota archaeon]
MFLAILMCERCEKFSTCVFVARYEADVEKQFALWGFIRLFCLGEKRRECALLKIAESLGADKVPANMMPNGLPLSGTTRDGWALEIQALL